MYHRLHRQFSPQEQPQLHLPPPEQLQLHLSLSNPSWLHLPPPKPSQLHLPPPKPLQLHSHSRGNMPPQPKPCRHLPSLHFPPTPPQPQNSSQGINPFID